MSNLLTSLAATVTRATSSLLFFDAVLYRSVPGVGSDPIDPPAPTTNSYTCRALDTEFSRGMVRDGLVDARDVQVLILGSTISVEPQPSDKIVISRPEGDVTVYIGSAATGRAAVVGDPARATWSCRCRR